MLSYPSRDAAENDCLRRFVNGICQKNISPSHSQKTIESPTNKYKIFEFWKVNILHSILSEDERKELFFFGIFVDVSINSFSYF